METQDLNKANNRSGHEAHGVHTCHKCGWPFPNPHPSAKHRRAHKRICGTVQGYNSSSSPVVDLGGPELEEKNTIRSNASDDDDDQRVSDDGGGNPSSKGRSVSGSKTEEEVLADPVKNLTDGAGAECFSNGVKEQADMMQKNAEDNTGHTSLPGDNAVVAGNLCLEKSPSGSQLQTSQCCRAEEERLEEDKASHESFSGSSSTINPVKSEPDTGRAERIATVDVSQASAVTTSLYSNEKGSKEQVISKLSASSPGDSSDSPSASPVLEETGKLEALMDTENLCSPEVESIKEMDMVQDSPQAENNANGKAGSSNKTVEEGLVSSADCVGIPYAAGNVPLKELPEIILEDFNDLKEGNMIIGPSLGSFIDVGVVEHHQKDCASQDPESTTSAYYPDGNIKHMSEDAIPQVGDLIEGKVKMETTDAKSTEEAGLKGSVEKTDMDALASDLCGSRNVSSIQEDLDFDKDERTEKVESFEEQKPLLGCDNTLEHNAINTLKEVEAVHGGENFDNEDSQIHDVLEDEGLKGDEGKLRLRDDMNQEIANDDASDVSETTKLLGGDGVSDTTKRVEREKSSNFVVSSYGKVEDEKNYQHDNVAADMDSTSNYVSKTVESDFQLKNFQELQAGVKELGSSKDRNISGEGTGSGNMFATSSMDVGSVYRSHELKIPESAAASRLSNSNEGETHMGNTGASSEGVKEQNDSSENVSGEESIVKVDSGLTSDYGAGSDPTKKTADGVVLLQQGDSVSIVQSSAAIDKVVVKEMGKEEVSGIVGKCDTTSLKHDEFVSSSDFHADSRSKNDGLEGNRRSISDASPVTETGSLPSQAWVDAEKPYLHPTAEAEGSDDKSDLADLTLVDQKERSGLKEVADTIEPLQKPEEKDKNSPGRKKIEEVFSKVTNRSNVKREHMPLQSLLGEPDQTGAIPPTESKDNSAKTERAILDIQEKPVGEAAKEEVPKEWNSPARYPANIKREKGKVRSRTYWAPFICCSSIETN